MKKINFFLYFLVFLVQICSATITLDAPYANGMVLPSNSYVNLSLKSDQESPVVVIPSWGQEIRVRQGRGGAVVQLHTLPAGGPYSITIMDGNSTKVISDIYFGKVILLVGQSNAEMPMYLPNSGYPLIPEGQAEYNSGLFPQIRFCRVPQTRRTTPQTMPPAPSFWEKGDTTERARASAIGWRAAKKIHLQTGEPVGVLSITYGGTPIEQWIPRDILLTLPFGSQQLANPGSELWCQVYNAMVHPFRNFSVNAVIWYQGEGNVWTYDTYADRLSAYMNYLKNEFSSPGLVPSMYCVEIAPYNGYTNLGSPFIRMEQSDVSQTLGMHFVSTSDVTTDIFNIHPINKFIVGDRIGQSLINDFNNIAPTPQFKISGKTIVGNQVTVSFTGAYGAIHMTRPDGFYVVNGNGSINPADTVVVNGDTITVSSSLVSNPIGVRYGWSNDFMSSVFDSNNTPLVTGLN